jgi:hypothetical protein
MMITAEVMMTKKSRLFADASPIEMIFTCRSAPLYWISKEGRLGAKGLGMIRA